MDASIVLNEERRTHRLATYVTGSEFQKLSFMALQTGTTLSGIAHKCLTSDINADVPSSNETKKQRLGIYVTEDEFQKLSLMALQKNTSISSIIHKCLTTHTNTEEEEIS